MDFSFISTSAFTPLLYSPHSISESCILFIMILRRCHPPHKGHHCGSIYINQMPLVHNPWECPKLVFEWRNIFELSPVEVIVHPKAICWVVVNFQSRPSAIYLHIPGPHLHEAVGS